MAVHGFPAWGVKCAWCVLRIILFVLWHLGPVYCKERQNIKVKTWKLLNKLKGATPPWLISPDCYRASKDLKKYLKDKAFSQQFAFYPNVKAMKATVLAGSASLWNISSSLLMLYGSLQTWVFFKYFLSFYLCRFSFYNNINMQTRCIFFQD